VADPRAGLGRARETARNASSEIRRRLGVFLSSDRFRLVRAGGLGWVIAGVGFVAGLLLVITEFLHISYITTITASCSDFADPKVRDSCLTVGHESHHWGFVVLGLFVMVMTFGAVVGGSRPAAIALLVAGVVGLGITLLHDLPNTTKKGEIGVAFARAKAHKGAGFWVELVASALAIGAGGFIVVRRPEPLGPRLRLARGGGEAAPHEPASA
jgi:hypothetical protein